MSFTKNYATKKRMKNRHKVGEISAKQKPVNLVFKPQKTKTNFFHIFDVPVSQPVCIFSVPVSQHFVCIFNVPVSQIVVIFVVPVSQPVCIFSVPVSQPEHFGLGLL